MFGGIHVGVDFVNVYISCTCIGRMLVLGNQVPIEPVAYGIFMP